MTAEISCRNPDPCENRVVIHKRKDWLMLVFQFTINLALFAAGIWLGHAWQRARYDHAVLMLRNDRDKWRTAYDTINQHADAIQKHFDQHHDEDEKILKAIHNEVRELKRGKK